MQVYANDAEFEATVNRFPQDVRSVIRVLLKREENLTDGYEFHGGNVDSKDVPIETLTVIAREIARAVNGQA